MAIDRLQHNAASSGARLSALPGESAAAGLPRPDAGARSVASLAGRSPRTISTYQTALGRLHEYLESTGADLNATRTTEFRGDLLERLYLWLARIYGRDD